MNASILLGTRKRKGGVGIAATQIAQHIGAGVIGTSSASKHARLRALGVDHLIDYRTKDFEVRAREIMRIAGLGQREYGSQKGKKVAR